MKGYSTVKQAAKPDKLNRSPHYIRTAIHLGLIKAERIGNQFLIPNREIKRVRAYLPRISKDDYRKK